METCNTQTDFSDYKQVFALKDQVCLIHALGHCLCVTSLVLCVILSHGCMNCTCVPQLCYTLCHVMSLLSLDMLVRIFPSPNLSASILPSVVTSWLSASETELQSVSNSEWNLLHVNKWDCLTACLEVALVCASRLQLGPFALESNWMSVQLSVVIQKTD